jgi:putative ABC transport system permease protein
MIREIRFALRALMRTPVFTLVCVAMLATGIGLSMYMFTSINAFVLKPLPFPKPEQLVHFEYTDSRSPTRNIALPALDWLDLRERQHTLESLAAYTAGTVNLGGGEGNAERVSGTWLSADAFPSLGVAPKLGREFNDADQRAGAPAVALISALVWKQRFSADPQIVGREVRINGTPTRIIGVMPDAFAFPRDSAIWLPLTSDRAAATDSGWRVKAFGRLKSGVSIAQARADFAGMMQVLATERGEPLRGDQQKIEPFADEFILPQILTSTKTMFVAVLLVLLIACANVATLVLARFSARARELSVRSALGATRSRLVVQVLTETVVIAVVASVLGYFAADFAGSVMVRSLDAEVGGIPYWVDYSIDLRDIIFSVGIALASALLAGLVPALRAGRVDVVEGLRQGGSGSIGDRGRLGRSLVAGEVALCVVLLVCAGVAIRSAQQAQQAPLGIDIDGILTGRVALYEENYADKTARMRLLDTLEPRLRELPGVSAVAFASTLPLMGYEREKYARIGDTETEDSRRPQLWTSSVSPEFFRVFGITLQEGRLFDGRDTASSRPVAIVSQSLAKVAWPDSSALGQRIRVDPKDTDSAWLEVIGVVSDSVQADYLQTSATQAAHRGDGNVFRPYVQNPRAAVSLAMRADGNVLALGEAVRAVFASVDKELPVYWLRSMEEWRTQILWGSNLIADLFGVFAAFALLLAVAGIYAVLAFDVTRRKREIGVRRALGASPSNVLAMVLKRGWKQVLIGVLIGTPLAFAFSRLLAGVVMPGAASDPVVYIAVIAALTLALVLAAVVPVRRALRVDPMQALREE